MRIGVQLPEVERVVRWPELKSMAAAAEAAGLDSIWVGDHLLYRHPDEVVGPWEAWTVLAGLAAVTDTVAIGPLVAALPFHNPALLAKQVAAVQEISGGRLIFGVGAGWNQTEFAAFGLPYSRRVDRFADSMGVIRRLLAGETVTHRSEFVTLEECVIRPRSRFGVPPIIVGSNRPRMLSLTLPWVDGWNTWFRSFGNDVDRLRKLAADIDRACLQAGRDPATLEKSAALLMQFGPARATSRGDNPWRGTPQELAEGLGEVEALGIGHVQLVLDPITLESIEAAAAVVGAFQSR